MNAVWNSYGQLCGCPEIFKKSCKFFCRELDIRVSQIVKTNIFEYRPFQRSLQALSYCGWVQGQISSLGGKHPIGVHGFPIRTQYFKDRL